MRTIAVLAIAFGASLFASIAGMFWTVSAVWTYLNNVPVAGTGAALGPAS